MFISFEGGDGAGKSTQIGNLKSFLESKGFNVLLTRQPGGSALGSQIRQLILDPVSDDKPGTMAEIFLYIADRAHHVESVILPALKNNMIVICDRYTDSTLAYQGYARQQNLEQLRLLNDIATKGLKPDLTFYLDITPEDGLERVRKNRTEIGMDRIESEKIDFHNRVRQGYLEIAGQEPERVKVIDSSQSVDSISEILKRMVVDYLNSNQVKVESSGNVG